MSDFGLFVLLVMVILLPMTVGIVACIKGWW